MPQSTQSRQSEIFKDPDFLKLSPEQKTQIFSRVEPEFAALNPSQQQQFMDAVQKRQTVNSLSNLTPSMGPSDLDKSISAAKSPSMLENIAAPFRRAGTKIANAEQTPVSSMLSAIAGMAKMPFQAVGEEFDRQPKDQMERTLLLRNSMPPGFLAAKRMLIDPAASMLHEETGRIKEGMDEDNPYKAIEGLAGTALSFLPGLGPAGKDIAEQMGSGDILGAGAKALTYKYGAKVGGKVVKGAVGGLAGMQELPGLMSRARAAYEELASKHNERPIDSPRVQKAYAKAKKAMEQEGEEGFTIPKPLTDFVAFMEKNAQPGLVSAGEPNAFMERPAGGLNYRAARNFISSLGSAIEWDKPAGGKGGAVDRLAKGVREDLKGAVHETLEPLGDKEKAVKADRDFETSLKWLRRLKLAGNLGGKVLGYGTGHPFAGASLGGKLGTAGGEAFGERLVNGKAAEGSAAEGPKGPERADRKSTGVNEKRDTGSMARAKSELPPNAPLSQVVARALEINQEFNDPTRRYKGPSKTLEMSKVNEGIHRNLQARIENAKTAGEKFVAVQKLRAFEAKMGGFEVTDPRGNEALQNIINRNENKPRSVEGDVLSKGDNFALDASFTDEGLRARFNLKPDVSLRNLQDQGLIDRGNDGLWRVAGGEALRRLQGKSLR